MVSVSNGLLSIPEDDQTLVFEDGVPYLRQAKQVVDMKHHQPISVGVSVRKSLGKGFSVETGLTYTAFFGCKVCGQRPEDRTETTLSGYSVKSKLELP